MAEGDEEKTDFFIREEVFCYRRLPFGQKNARATYQKLADRVFDNQVRCILEIHIDDMVIKSNSEEDMQVIRDSASNIHLKNPSIPIEA
ncbi:hypothetical protein Tco_0687009 [Tanacetum coccineum]